MKQKLLLYLSGLLFCCTFSLHAQTSDPWDGTSIATSFAGGNGTQNDPYLISTGNELAYLAQLVNTGNSTQDKYYCLTQNIDLNGMGWTPIGNVTYPFKGNFDGNGNAIYNLNIPARYNSGNYGFFAHIDGASINNFGIDGSSSVFLSAYSNTTYALGGITGYANNSTFNNCYNKATVHASSSVGTSNSNTTFYGGGIVGYMVGTTVTNCYNSGGITGQAQANYNGDPIAGGIAGYMSASNISNCYNTRGVNAYVQSSSSTAYPYSGGIVGKAENSSTITNCYNLSSVQSQSSSSSNSIYVTAGGIIGQMQAGTTVTSCYSSGSISVSSSYGTRSAGGIIGRSAGTSTITACFYLDTSGGSSAYGGTAKTGVVMKSAEFVVELNNGGFSFMQDTEPFANNGYPVYNTQEVLLSFNTNGGEPMENMFFLQRFTYSALPLPVKTGYLFENWYFDPLFEEVALPNQAIGNISRTLYARWKSPIVFNTRGGEPINPGEYFPDSAFLCTKNSGLPIAVRTGYTFVEWIDKNSTVISNSSIVGAPDTLQAVWNINVSFNTHGGDPLSPEILKGSTSYNSLPVPIKTGYVFAGWYYNMNYTDQRYSSDIVPYRNDTLYAQWGDRVMVHFNSNGGTPVASREYYPLRAYNNSYTSDGVTYNNGFPANPVKDNAIFADWYKEGAYSPTYAGETVVNEGHTLHAKWNYKKEIALNTNGGNPMGSIQNYTGYRYNATVYVNGQPYANTFPATPVKPNAVFLGWYTEPEFYYEISNTSTVEETTHTLYAKWGEKITVSFETYGGTPVAAVDNYTGKAYNATFTVNGQSYTNSFPSDPVKANAVFLGWYDSPAYTNKITTPSMVESTHTILYAKWGEKITISFETYGGTPVAAIENYTGGRYNETVMVNGQSYINKYPGSSSKSGAYFQGWYDSPLYVNQITNTSIVESNHTVLYAKWSEPITISFETYGGSFVSNQNYYHGYNFSQSGVNNGLPANPTKPGAYFLGWYDSPSYINNVTNSTMVQSTHSTLYAKWSETITVRFETYGGTTVGDKAYYTDYAFSYGAVNTGLPATPTKGDALFLGWYDGDDFTYQVTNSSIVNNGISILYARWGEKVTTVFIDYMEDTEESKDYYTNLSYSASPNTNLPTPVSLSNPAFIGWFAKVTGVKDQVQSSDAVANRHHTLHARWGVNVSFVTNGSEAIADKVYSTGMTYATYPNEGLPETPYREGFGFDGWYLEPALTTLVTENSMVVDGSHTLYAKWKAPTTVLVVFMTNGGDIIPPDYYQADGLKYGQHPNAGLPVPVKTNHMFVGWYSDNSFNNLVTGQSIIPNTNHTLYAKWEVLTSTESVNTDEVIVYPNPVKETLYVKTAQNIRKIEIYDGKGILVLRTTNNASEIDMRSLAKGTYVLRVVTDRTTISGMIIKE